MIANSATFEKAQTVVAFIGSCAMILSFSDFRQVASMASLRQPPRVRSALHDITDEYN